MSHRAKIRTLDRWCCWHFPIIEDVCAYLLGDGESIEAFRARMIDKYDARAALAAPEPGDAEAKLDIAKSALRDQLTWVRWLLEALKTRIVEDEHGRPVNSYAYAESPDWDLRQHAAFLETVIAAIAAPDMGGSAPLGGEGENS